jgi:hypothetical protein
MYLKHCNGIRLKKFKKLRINEIRNDSVLGSKLEHCTQHRDVGLSIYHVSLSDWMTVRLLSRLET